MAAMVMSDGVVVFFLMSRGEVRGSGLGPIDLGLLAHLSAQHNISQI